MSEIRRLTQDETDLLHFIKQHRRNLSSITQEEFDLLKRLSDEFPRPMPTEVRREEDRIADRVLAPIRALLLLNGGRGSIDRQRLADAICMHEKEAER